MTQFFETLMGKRFFEGTMPKLVRAIERLTEDREYEHAFTVTSTSITLEPMIVGDLQRPEGKGWRPVAFERGTGSVAILWEREVKDRKST